METGGKHGKEGGKEGLDSVGKQGKTNKMWGKQKERQKESGRGKYEREGESDRHCVCV